MKIDSTPYQSLGIDVAYIRANQAFEQALFRRTTGEGGVLAIAGAEWPRHGLRRSIDLVAAQKSRIGRMRYLAAAGDSFGAWEAVWTAPDGSKKFQTEKVPALLSAFGVLMQKHLQIGLAANPADPLQPFIDSQSHGLKRGFVEDVRKDLHEFTDILLPHSSEIPEKETLKFSLTPVEREKIARKLLADIGVDMDRLELSFRVRHPLCQGAGDRVFLGLNVNGKTDAVDFILEVLHEGFHALLRQQVPIMTHAALDEVFAILGDQAIGRTMGFAHYAAALLSQRISADDFFRHANALSKSTARITANAAQYPRGISMLYNMEAALMGCYFPYTPQNPMPVDRIEEFFNSWHKKHYSQIPGTPEEGAFQDMQSFTGAATFRSGSYLVAQPAAFQVLETLYKDHAEWEGRVGRGDWSNVIDLVKQIAPITACYDLHDFMLQATGDEYSLEPYKKTMQQWYKVLLHRDDQSD